MSPVTAACVPTMSSHRKEVRVSVFLYLVGTEGKPYDPMPLLTPTDNWLSSPPVPSGDTYLIFYASRDITGRMWCPVRVVHLFRLLFRLLTGLLTRVPVSSQDCRNIESQVDDAFRGDDKPPLFVVYVGSRDEYADSFAPRLRASPSIPFILTACPQVETAR